MNHKVLLYGNSILMVGLTSRLQHVPGWEAVRAEGDGSGDLGGMEFILVDLRDARTPRILPRLASFPDASLIGLDALTNTVTVLAGKPQQATCMQKMLDLLKEAM